jgi:hypothetical protein
MSNAVTPPKSKVSLAPVKALADAPLEISRTPTPASTQAARPPEKTTAALRTPVVAKPQPVASVPVMTAAPAVQAAREPIQAPAVKAAAPARIATPQKPAASAKAVDVPHLPTGIMADLGEKMLKQHVSTLRNLGSLQAKVLDHALSEIKAGLGDAEEISRSNSLADALAIQTRAWRRGHEAMVSHFGEMARIVTNGARVG